MANAFNEIDRLTGIRAAFAVTPDDDADLPFTPRAVFCGGGGDLVVILADNENAVTLKGVPAGAWLPIVPKQIMEATTCTDILIGR